MVNSPGKSNPIQSVNCHAIFDSRTTLIWGPKNYVSKLNSYLGAIYDRSSKLYVFGLDKNCSFVDQNKRVTFKISNINFSLAYNEYTFINNNICFSAFVPQEETENDWFLGDIFLLKYYTIYDYSKKQIGIAEAV